MRTPALAALLNLVVVSADQCYTQCRLSCSAIQTCTIHTVYCECEMSTLFYVGLVALFTLPSLWKYCNKQQQQAANTTVGMAPQQIQMQTTHPAVLPPQAGPPPACATAKFCSNCGQPNPGAFCVQCGQKQ